MTIEEKIDQAGVDQVIELDHFRYKSLKFFADEDLFSWVLTAKEVDCPDHYPRKNSTGVNIQYFKTIKGAKRNVKRYLEILF